MKTKEQIKAVVDFLQDMTEAGKEVDYWIEVLNWILEEEDP